jgi:hypothetical protein
MMYDLNENFSEEEKDTNKNMNEEKIVDNIN